MRNGYMRYSCNGIVMSQLIVRQNPYTRNKSCIEMQKIQAAASVLGTEGSLTDCQTFIRLHPFEFLSVYLFS